MSRIPYPDWSDVSKEKREAVGYPDKHVLNVSRLALWAPDGLWRAHSAYKRAMIYETKIDERLREILILRVAHLSRSEYELRHHLSISANLGFTHAQQEALRIGDYSKLSEPERAVAEFTDDVVGNRGVADKTLEKVRKLFGEPQVIEMLIVIASYVGTALLAKAAGVEPDTEPVRSWSSPAGDKP
jgi:alkylhydroperoxidase family enzyme